MAHKTSYWHAAAHVLESANLDVQGNLASLLERSVSYGGRGNLTPILTLPPRAGSQPGHRIPEPRGSGKTRKDTKAAAIRVPEDTRGAAGMREDMQLRRFGTVRPRVQIPGSRPNFTSTLKLVGAQRNPGAVVKAEAAGRHRSSRRWPEYNGCCAPTRSE